MPKNEEDPLPIPDFQTIMLPFLRHIFDGKDYSNREITDGLARHFRLTPEERNTLLPSGRQKVFENRVAWAKAHLKIAGLLHTPNRGITAITEKGLNVLKKNPKSIDLKFLRQFPEYLERVDQGRKKPEKEKPAAGDVKPPQEEVKEHYAQIDQSFTYLSSDTKKRKEFSGDELTFKEDTEDSFSDSPSDLSISIKTKNRAKIKL